MASFCAYCGRPLADGEVCSCRQQQAPVYQAPPAYVPPTPQPAPAPKPGFMEGLKRHMGIGAPNPADPYETGKQLVPDCVKQLEAEVPIKQYEVAKLQRRIFSIPYADAVGRLQVTNKRILFRASGKGLFGPGAVQQEAAVEELSGVEVRKDHYFCLSNLILGILTVLVGGFLMDWLLSLLFTSDIGYTASVIILVLVAAGCCLPFALAKRAWLLKLLALGGALIPLYAYGTLIYGLRSQFVGGLLLLMFIAVLAATLFTLFVFCIRPTFCLILKAKNGKNAIAIRRRRCNPFGSGKEEFTGYTEIAELDDAAVCVNEINALLQTVQAHTGK